MKKVLPVIIAVLMILSITATVSAKDPFATINVPKCATAPEIDGVISSGEYKLVATYDKTKSAWNRDSSTDFQGKSPEAYVYATWDEKYFYLAVKIKNLDPNYTVGKDKYVFQQPSLMTAMVYDDPTLAVFASKDGKDWDWGDANAASFSREWTIGLTKEGEDFKNHEVYVAAGSPVNHFGAVRDHADYKWAVKHGTYDVYEQAIPWAAIAKTSGIEVGGKCGLALSANVLSTTSEYAGGYICFASGISGGKSFDRYAQVTLTANEPFEEDTSEPATSEPQTPPTGDISAVLSVISVIAAAGAGVVLKRRSR